MNIEALKTASGREFASAFQSANPSQFERILNAQDDPERTAFRSQIYEKRLAAGDGPELAMYHANQVTTPYYWALKWNGTPLPLDAERILENEVVTVAQKTRPGVTDLISRGLVRPLPDIGVLFDQWHRATDLGSAFVSMDINSAPFERSSFDTDGTPIPITEMRFQIRLREIAASRRSAVPLDTYHATAAAEKVSQRLEEMLMNGVTLAHGGFSLYGYSSHPNALTDTGAGFDTITNIIPSFVGGLETLRNANRMGPIGWYVPSTQYGEMLATFADSSGETALQRVMNNFGPQGSGDFAFIRRSQQLSAGTMIGVELSRSTIDLAIAQDVTTLPWETDGGTVMYWLVYAAIAPRIKKDTNNQTGIVKVSSI